MTSPRDPEVSSAFPPSVVVPIQASRAAPEKPKGFQPQAALRISGDLDPTPKKEG